MATMSARYTVIDGEVIAQERSGVRHQLVPDPLGSTVALYDDSGTKTDTFEYWPYGEIYSITGTTTLRFKFFGKIECAQNGNYIHLKYSNVIRTNYCRFIQINYFSPKEGNGYTYGSNPVSTTEDVPPPQLPGKPFPKLPPIRGIQIPWLPIPPFYGKYCGPQTKPGEGEGIDPLDRCCESHDVGFAKACPPCTLLNQGSRADCRKITSDFCDCLKKVNCNQYPKNSIKYWHCTVTLELSLLYACPPPVNRIYHNAKKY